MNIVDAAKFYAKAAHDAVGQVRKYTKEPYWHHTFAVAAIVQSYGFNEKVVAAAVLHDVVEDTGITLEQVQEAFGIEVATFVENVTDISKPEDGNRKTRKKIDLEHLAKATYEGKSIKLADLIHNTNDIVKYDKDFARVYVKEKEALLNEALFDGHPALLAEAWKVLNEAKEKVNKV